MADRQRAIVTGGGSGIGAALAWHLAAQGLDVLIVGRRAEALEAVREESPERIRCVTADLAEPEGRRAVAEAAGDDPVDFLVHNAGIVDPVASLAEVAPDDWRANFAINLEAPVFLTQALLDRLDGGRILLVSSGAAHHPVRHWSAYCCAKAALVMLCECYNVELNSRNILCAAARPGVADTPMQAHIRHCDETQFPDVNRFRELHAQGRLHPPHEVAAFFGWLLLECGSGAYPSREWDIDDPDHHPLWKEAV